MSDPVRTAIAALVDRKHPGREAMGAAFEAILKGEAEPALISGFLVALRTKGETADDIVAGARVMRANVRPVAAPAGAIDTCGTGGLGWTTLNTSTTAAFVAAGAGAVVAKHGNRSKSKAGSADVLEALDINLSPTDEQIQTCFRQARLAFMFAPAHHSAMKHVAPVRAALGIRTIFNFLGPLANPAGVRRQVLGVFSPDWVEPYAQALKDLGSERAWVVHALDGMDEISTTGATLVAELRDGKIRQFELTPEEMGVKRASMDELRGGTVVENAAQLVSVLAGAPSAFADLVTVNAAAALLVGDHARTFEEAMDQARASIRDGGANAALTALRMASNG